MASDHKHERETGDVAQIVRDALDASPARPEFIEELGERIATEFATLHAPHTQNGRVPVANNQTATHSTPQTRNRRRAMVALVVAASLLVAVFTLNMQPTYSWAAMIEALESQPWVGESSDTPAGRIIRFWIAREGRKRSAEDDLLDFVLNGDVPKDASVRVVRQSWQKAPNDLVQLNVKLALDSAKGESENLELELMLDPETKLPLQCRLLRSEIERELQFDYSLAPPNETPPSVDTTVGELAVAAASPSEQAAVSPSIIAVADEPQPAEPFIVLGTGEMADRIDAALASVWQTNGIHPVGPSGDEEFLRRVYLDLTGRIPTVSEYRMFVSVNEPTRREQLVDELLSRHDHASHLAAVWGKFLLPAGVDLDRYGGTAAFETWLTDRFRENVPYDQLVSELLLAEGRTGEKGPVLFYTAHKLAPEELAGHTARAFLGVRMECAQCHDHFFDDRWTQEDFWAYAAFFARISRPEGKMDMISPVLRVADSRRGEVMLPDTEDIVAPRFPLGHSSEDTPEGHSRRERLVDWLTAADNEHFARATVNRVWAHLFGRGLVDPVDDMRPDNSPISPELLDDLANYFRHTGFDLQRLVKTIVMSQTYQLTSASADDDPSRMLHFAQMNVKPFSAEQLYDSIAVATRLEPLATDGMQANQFMRRNNLSRRAFLAEFSAPPGQSIEYQVGIPQALTLMNGPLMHQATGLSTSGLVRSLEAPFFTNSQRLETLFMATLTRTPEDAEVEKMLPHIESGGSEAMSDVLWALLNSAEFTLNH